MKVMRRTACMQLFSNLLVYIVGTSRSTNKIQLMCDTVSSIYRGASLTGDSMSSSVGPLEGESPRSE